MSLKATAKLMVYIFALGLIGVLFAACALVTNQNANVYVVKDDCGDASRCFSSIQKAIDAINQAPSSGWVHLNIAEGDYYEKLTISRSKLKVSGAGLDKTRVFYDAVARDAGHFHRDGWGTAGSATVTVNADEVSLFDLSIENTFGYIANDALPERHANKIRKPQGVALLLDINSDRVYLSRVALLGYQDTLFANGARAYLRNTTIAGNIDFIFGNGQLVIEDSDIVSRRRGKPMEEGSIHSYIAAPSTQLSDAFGIVFIRSRLTREKGVPDRSVTLARPWHPTTTFTDGRYADPNAVGQVSFINCFMDAHIHEQHWSEMNGTARDGSKSAVFFPQDSRFNEHGSFGPGSKSEAKNMTWSESWDLDELRAMFFRNWDLTEQ